MTYERLRLAREEKGWSLAELSRRSGVGLKNIELIDRGELTALPAGLYGRSAIRRYAAAVGLDPNEVMESLGRFVLLPEDPLDGLARRCGHARKAEPSSRELSPDPCSPPVTLIEDIQPEALLRPALTPVLDLVEIPDAPLTGRRWLPDGTWWRPLAASAIDGTLLAMMGAVLVWLTAIACGTSVAVALRAGAPGVALVFALIVALYFVLFGGVGNATLGVSLMRLDERPSGRIVLNPRDVFGRARRSIFPDSSLLAE